MRWLTAQLNVIFLKLHWRENWIHSTIMPDTDKDDHAVTVAADNVDCHVQSHKNQKYHIHGKNTQKNMIWGIDETKKTLFFLQTQLKFSIRKTINQILQSLPSSTYWSFHHYKSLYAHIIIFNKISRQKADDEPTSMHTIASWAHGCAHTRTHTRTHNYS